MSAAAEATARAFSSHRFDEVYPRLAEDVVWTLVGSDVIRGRDGVIAACEQTRGGLADVSTEVSRFVVAAGEASVAVDTVTGYTDASGETTAVASCDVYEFDRDTVVAITSYTVDVTDRE